MRHLYQLTNLPHPTRHREKGHKECNSQNIGKNAKKKKLSSGHDREARIKKQWVVSHQLQYSENCISVEREDEFWLLAKPMALMHL